MNGTGFLQQPLFGIAATVAAYAAARLIQRRWKWLHPLFVTAGGLIVLLVATGIPYEDYRIGGDWIAFGLGPATVALGVPLYKQAARIRSQAAGVLAGITAGSFSAGLSAVWIAWLFGAHRDILMTMLPKSVTTPIAVEISRQLGGIPELTAVVTTLTGLFGSMVGPGFLRMCGIRSDIAIGTAMGTTSHGIGTARLVRESELQAGVSGFAMAVSGILTSVGAIPLYSFLGH